MPLQHNSNIALSNDDQWLLLFKDDNGIGNIYESVLEGDQWSVPEKLPAPINTAHHESSSGVSQDGNTMYFVSDRLGGQGGKDIYKCTKQDEGTWEEAINLGKTINSKKDEEGVFIHPDGITLYFSSNGHNTMGGYDIYRSELKNGQWSEPQNLGEPINTKDDDLFFVLTANGEHGYFASTREKRGLFFSFRIY